MRISRRTNNLYALTITGLSVACWIVLLLNPGDIIQVKHCHVTMMGPSEASLNMLLAMNPFSELMTGWILMVLAMMLPKLITPVQYICERSFKTKRAGLTLLFILGYTAMWTAAGLFLNVVILGFNLIMPQSFYPAIIIGILTLIWQFSPVKQRFLNRGHEHLPLAAFGWRAGFDALRAGLTHGVWCIGAGWALMLFPMLLPEGHNTAMLIVTIIMISEHMEHPQLPRWNMNLRLKLLRIMITQTKMRLIQASTDR